MKKVMFLIVLIVAVLLVSISANREVAGDVTGDGHVTESDLILVQQHVLGAVELTEVEQKRADTNKDGVINIVDLANIQKIILGVD